MGTRTLTDVRLGAQGVDANTSGTLYFDDPSTGSGQASNRVDSRTLALSSEAYRRVGTLTVLRQAQHKPGVDDPQATNQAGWFARTYQYNATIPHAVTSVNPETGSADTYTYDANGNMIYRVEGGVTFKQDYNAENRISAIHKLALSEGEVMNGNCSTGTVTESWLYGYDGDGVRVSTAHYTGVTQDSLTLYYMGGAYEVTGSAVKKYYSMAGQTIMRDTDGSLKYLLTDHLGSTSAVVDANGTLLSQQRYLPFGEVRTDTNPLYITQTDFTYTGQRNLSGTGLMDYRARMYSPQLGRFVQPDSIIPNPVNPQAFNRFSYVYNRPISFTDPSGHDPWWCEGNDYCMYMWIEDHTTTGGDAYFEEYGVTVDEKMTKREKHAIMAGIYAVGNKIAETRNNGESASKAFTAVFEPITFTKSEKDYQGCVYQNVNEVSCSNFTYEYFQSDVNNVVHELGHVIIGLGGGALINLGWMYATRRSDILRPDTDIDWQQHPEYRADDPVWTGSEMFGDMLVAWVFDAWNASPQNATLVNKAREDLNTNMAAWLNR